MPDITQWEYKTLTFGPNAAHQANPSEIRKQLDQEGAQGWEHYDSDRFGADVVMYLKRRREVKQPVKAR